MATPPFDSCGFTLRIFHSWEWSRIDRGLSGKIKKDLNVENITISPRLATFTLVNVLKSQGLYYQALDILDILAQRGEDKKQIAKERKLIKAEL